MMAQQGERSSGEVGIPTMSPEEVAEWEKRLRDGRLFATITERRHGIRTMYIYGCRCGACRAANTEYQRKHRYAALQASMADR